MSAPAPSRLLILNGVYGAPEHLAPLCQALAPDLATTIFTFTRRGLTYPTPESGFAPMVERLVDELDKPPGVTGPQPVFGFSLGGAWALELALAHPERVSALILVNSFARYRKGPMQGGALPALRVWPPAWAHPAATARIVYRVDWLRRSLFHAGTTLAEIERGVRAATAAVSQDDLRFQLAHLELTAPRDLAERIEALARRMPILLVSSRDDQVVPPHHTEWLASHMPGARRLTYDGGHAFFQHDGVALAREVRKFLDSRDGAGAKSA